MGGFLRVTFDDGTTVDVHDKPRDKVIAERGGHDFIESGPFEGMYAVAWAGLHRLKRAGELPEQVSVPDVLTALADVADVQRLGDEDPEGKDEDPAHTAG
jgi:hypothetical protein